MISSTIFSEKQKKTVSPKLSLVALMDIFTILVFFLLLNSGEAQKIENAKFIKLPDSTKGDVPHEELMILVNPEEIWVGKEKILDLEGLEYNPEEVIEELSAELLGHTEKLENLTPFQEANGLAVIIMGDREVPYALLKSVMTTCRANNFLNISLAVNRVVDTRIIPSSAGPLDGEATSAPVQGEG
ncbi:ExbD/TolR family protein [Agarilytica rhodophyticola]|uniref:ExbD/TolR family protein n=1 Tax=Agarilytica rhodophyticola TaxID=1737490 RepID=UPI000B3452D2|nr:biopolymer transporter ExbD [Agarilytica rhodophyticola]